jgi:hypothetical protein
MRKLLTTTTFFLLLSCRPEAPVTEYQKLISVPDVISAKYATDEDQMLVIDYLVEKNDDSVDFQIAIMEGVRNGRLDNCSGVDGVLSCEYTPKKDFYGKDSFTVFAKDGGLTSKNTAIIEIEVAPVPDGPSVGKNTQKDTMKNTKLSFSIERATDPDSAADQLTYIVANAPQNGQLINCFMQSGSRACEYMPDPNFVGSDSFSYFVQDETGLQSDLVQVTINTAEESFVTKETFIQNKVNGAVDGFDLVWVIDNSGSMDDEQDELALNTASFIEKFIASNIASSDFKMAVTTTEAYYSDAETFRRDANMNVYDFSKDAMVNNQAQFIQDFQNAVQIGNTARFEGGNQIEKVFASMERIHTAEAGWFRDDKKALLYIFLTDEPEQSVEKTTEQWLAQFDALKDKASKVKMFPIYRLNQDAGNRFRTTAEHYNIPQYSIVENFDTILENITLNIANLLSSFSLTPGRIIDINTVEIKVNGTVIPRVNGNGEVQWTINQNSLSFVTEPPAGANIEVNYRYTINI